MKKTRIGLFGGTFNPIHLGHLKAAELCLERVALDKILFIPSYIPPHKETVEVVSPFHRLKMVELACAPYSRFVPSSIEIEDRGTSYSIITLKKIEKKFPGAWIFFILGADAFLEIETWKDYETLLSRCFFIVISRPVYSLNNVFGVLKGKYREKMHELTESEEIEEQMLSNYRIFILSIAALDIAATDIRSRIKRGESVSHLLPGPVEEYIIKNNLYRE